MPSKKIERDVEWGSYCYYHMPFPVVLKTECLQSCLGIAIYDTKQKIGILGHFDADEIFYSRTKSEWYDDKDLVTIFDGLPQMLHEVRGRLSNDSLVFLSGMCPYDFDKNQYTPIEKRYFVKFLVKWYGFRNLRTCWNNNINKSFDIELDTENGKVRVGKYEY